MGARGTADDPFSAVRAGIPLSFSLVTMPAVAGSASLGIRSADVIRGV